ncbi:MAG: hypothetical protein FJW99_04360 [Actinobacteria bacterium]|nr:hypothetical protein [Actinomycetota bacterium]MBM3696992.1 hypothetical protein [Actinomycetota bacterium]
MATAVNRRPFLARRITAIVAALIAGLAWLLAVFVWTSASKVTGTGGFTSVTVETMQSPKGTAVVTDALLDRVDAYATAQGYAFTSRARAQLEQKIEEAIDDAQFPGLIAPAVEVAREAYAEAPDGTITIDFASLRPLAVQKVQQVNPGLVSRIPPAEDLQVTVHKQNVPPVLKTIEDASSTLRWSPLWLLLIAVVFGALGLWASANRRRMLMGFGIASLVIALVPLAMYLAIPPITASFVEAGNPAQLVSTATVAILSRWWVSLLVALLVGVALIAASLYINGRSMRRSDPVMLGR